jgi:hypothetical protein
LAITLLHQHLNREKFNYCSSCFHKFIDWKSLFRLCVLLEYDTASMYYSSAFVWESRKY